jgi:hypothetical protein
MKLDRASLERMSAETGFYSGTLEKVMRLGEFLADVHRHPLLSRVLVLKGGTALNLGFGPPARLSVDLDFNYVGALEREAMLAERPVVERALETIASAEGYTLQKSADAHAGRKLYLGYRNVNGGADRIEIDANYLHRICLLETVIGLIWQPGGRGPIEASVLAPEELVAGSCVPSSRAGFLATCSMRLVSLRFSALAGSPVRRAGCSSRWPEPWSALSTSALPNA